MRDAFTLIELLVVVAILGLLATMLMPAVTGANESALKTADANNLKQLMTMYTKHRTDTRQTWAYPKALVGPQAGSNTALYNGSNVSDAAGATNVTVASFWELARANDLSPDLFNTPLGDPIIESVAGIDENNPYDTSGAVASDIARWRSNGVPPYMLDWSTPKTVGTIRPTLCNRDHETYYGNDINVCFADSHMAAEKDLEVVNAITVNHLALEDSGGGTDNILDNVGDQVGTVAKDWMMGRGHRKRAAMK